MERIELLEKFKVTYEEAKDYQYICTDYVGTSMNETTAKHH